MTVRQSRRADVLATPKVTDQREFRISLEQVSRKLIRRKLIVRTNFCPRLFVGSHPIYTLFGQWSADEDHQETTGLAGRAR